MISRTQPAGDDVIDQGGGHLAVGGFRDDGFKLQVHAVSLKISRPMSMRRISWVPAPIS